MREEARRELREKEEMRENIRIKKIQAVGGNQLNYAVQEIIKKTILNKESFQIELLDLGFSETMDGIGDATKLLNILKDNKCIGNFSNLSNRGFQIEKPDKHRLEIYNEYLNGTKKNLGHVKEGIKPKSLFAKDLSSEMEVGNLTAYSDGTIRYKKEIIPLRNQLKDLCRLFMQNPKRLITVDDIKEAIIHADKRKSTSHTTISKYVSELHNSLKIHFQKDVIFNQYEEGWYFDIK